MPEALPHSKGPFASRSGRRWSRWLLRGLLPGAAVLLIAHLLDPWVYQTLSVSKPELTELESRPVYRLVWLVGSMWLWLVIATGLYLHDRAPARLRADRPAPALGLNPNPSARALSVFVAAAAAGLLAEALKWIVKRERPTRLEGGEFIQQIYTFKWSHLLEAMRGGSEAASSGEHLRMWLSSSNLGLPSSHAAVAFAGAIALGLCAPSLRGLALSLAALCALSRVVASAHTLSDVVVGGAIGAACAVVVHRRALWGSTAGVVPSWSLGVSRTGGMAPGMSGGGGT